MDDSIITILVLAALGIVQLVASINKKKRAQEQRMRSQTGAYTVDADFEEMEEPDSEGQIFGLPELQEKQLPHSPQPSPLFAPQPSPFFSSKLSNRELKPKEEGGSMFKPLLTFAEAAAMETAAVEEEVMGEEDSVLYHFTPQQAILYSEIINSKWNS